MPNKRLLTAGGIIALFVIGVFALSVPHTTEVQSDEAAARMESSMPTVSLQDSFKKGVRTITGSVKAPDACATVEARAFLEASSTPPSIALALTMAPTSGICLRVPSYATFSVTVSAPKDAPIIATLNGAPVEQSR